VCGERRLLAIGSICLDLHHHFAGERRIQPVHVPWLADNLDTEPIFSLLEQKYNTPLVEAEYQLEAVCAEATVATALRIGVGSAIFLIQRTSYSIGQRPVDYEKLHYRGDQIRFVTRLARRNPVQRKGGSRK
jgi:DNA-binding GntR family transcriptional regulator